jgi:hypothetical protein
VNAQGHQKRSSSFHGLLQCLSATMELISSELSTVYRTSSWSRVLSHTPYGQEASQPHFVIVRRACWCHFQQEAVWLLFVDSVCPLHNLGLDALWTLESEKSHCPPIASFGWWRCSA